MDCRLVDMRLLSARIHAIGRRCIWTSIVSDLRPALDRATAAGAKHEAGDKGDLYAAVGSELANER